MCKVVELSLPDNYDFQLPTTKSTPSQNEDPEKYHISIDESSDPSEVNRESLHNIIRKSHSPSDKLKKLDLGEPQDDALNLAIGTSRSCQSSVLSHAISTKSPNTFPPLNHSPTVKELLTAAVKDLTPKKTDKQSSQTNEKSQKLTKSHELEISFDKLKDVSAKEFASLKTYRKHSYKAGLRKYIDGLYNMPGDKRSNRGKKPCVIEGKTFQKSKDCEDSPLLSLRISPSKPPRKELDNSKTDIFSPQTDSAKLRKRARQRQEAAEKYEQFKLAMALDKKKQQEANKLAIISKCQTVVKPQVSLKTVAI